MDQSPPPFDWNRARAFLVTAEHGSFSAAARVLNLAQPTLGRQVKALEEELGVALFERVGRGLELTPAGMEIAEHFRAMGTAADRAMLAASGQSQAIAGTVRITATEVVSAHILPPILNALRQAEPGITVEIVATNDLTDLRRREADIALRNVRPADPELIGQKLRPGSASLFAAKRYVAEHGPFETTADLAKASFLGFQDNEPYLSALNALELGLTSGQFPLLSANHLVQWEHVKQGAGIGVMVTQVGEAEPLVQRVGAWLPPFTFEFWLVAHRDLKTSRRVRLVFDWLFRALTA
ncbi:MAG: LysR family transcriptional regulator [Rhodospirillaceae bacterium]